MFYNTKNFNNNIKEKNKNNNEKMRKRIFHVV